MNVRRAVAAHILIACTFVTGVRAETYDLERCIDLALKTSTNVGISREQLSVARSGVVRSYAQFMPDLSMSAWLGHSFAGPSTGVFVDAQGRPVRPSGFDYEAYTFGIQSQMRLLDWGANVNGLTQSKRGADAAAYELGYIRDVVRAIVIREYYDLVRQRKLLGVQTADLDAKTRSLEQVEAFYKIGSRTKADYLQARVDQGNSQLQLLNVVNAEAIAAARLKSRLNIPQESPIAVDESIDFTTQDFNATTEIDFMFQHRPDLLASQQRIEAATAGTSVAKKGRYPTLDASFSYNWNDRTFPSSGEVFKRDYIWSVGVFFGWNIFDRFQSRSAIQAAEAQHRIAEYNLQQAKIDAVLDVKQIMLNLDQARERLDLATETVAAAEENNRLAQERYRVGAGTILETIEASASLTSAQASLIDARVDYLINRADLQRATGRPIVTE